MSNDSGDATDLMASVFHAVDGIRVPLAWEVRDLDQLLADPHELLSRKEVVIRAARLHVLCLMLCLMLSFVMWIPLFLVVVAIMYVVRMFCEVDLKGGDPRWFIVPFATINCVLSYLVAASELRTRKIVLRRNGVELRERDCGYFAPGSFSTPRRW